MSLTSGVTWANGAWNSAAWADNAWNEVVPDPVDALPVWPTPTFTLLNMQGKISMNLTAIGTGGALTGTGTFSAPDGLVGGVLITADGTNDATVILRKDSGSGDQIFDLVTKQPSMIIAPISTGGTTTVYYSITGTGAAAMFYEWNA